MNQALQVKCKLLINIDLVILSEASRSFIAGGAVEEPAILHVEPEFSKLFGR